MFRRVRSFGGLLACACLAAVCSCAVLLAQFPGERPFEQSYSPGRAKVWGSEADSAAQPVRLREGMHVTETIGHFETPVEGPVFVDEAGRRLAGLENLNLQRIARHLRAADSAPSVQWKITGTITEYEGRNYILIERAVYLPPRP